MIVSGVCKGGRDGCQGRPLMEFSAASTASALTPMAASTGAAPAPLVSCVWKCAGSPVCCVKARTSSAAALITRVAVSERLATSRDRIEAPDVARRPVMGGAEPGERS